MVCLSSRCSTEYLRLSTDKYGCFILGKGIEAPVFGAENEFHVSIYCRDDKSPFILPPESIEELELIVVGPQGDTQLLKPKNNKDGTYTSAYVASSDGEYDVAIKLFGKYLRGTASSLWYYFEFKLILFHRSWTSEGHEQCSTVGSGSLEVYRTRRGVD